MSKLPKELQDIVDGKATLKIKVVNYGTPEKRAELKALLELQKENIKRCDMNLDRDIVFK